MKYFTGLRDIVLLPNFCGYVNASYSYFTTTNNNSSSSGGGGEGPQSVLIAPSRGVSGSLLSSLGAAVRHFNSRQV